MKKVLLGLATVAFTLVASQSIAGQWVQTRQLVEIFYSQQDGSMPPSGYCTPGDVYYRMHSYIQNGIIRAQVYRCR